MLALLAFVLPAVALRAASPPAWLKPLLAEDVSAWKATHSAVVLLDFERTEYTGPDRVRVTQRSALRLTAEAGRRDATIALPYNADITKIRAARAWVDQQEISLRRTATASASAAPTASAP